jgi:hypothetical protein
VPTGDGIDVRIVNANVRHIYHELIAAAGERNSPPPSRHSSHVQKASVPATAHSLAQPTTSSRAA